MFTDFTTEQINDAISNAHEAFLQYQHYSLQQRAEFLKAIASELENCSDELINIAMQETNLPEARLRNEKARTIFQLKSYADACVKGNWLDASIDTANTERNPPKPDLRKTQIGLGVVVVYGASNFPFAYSTAGGDTASALAAGCSVVVKAHPAHAQTSEFVAKLIFAAAEKCNMPKGIFNHIHAADYKLGKVLVQHSFVKAVGFTGSFVGGKQLFDWANERTEPIPVFAEMGSTNPVFLLQEKLIVDAENTAQQLTASFTLGVGQFCTKPGIIVGIKSSALSKFTSILKLHAEKVAPTKMLHTGISKNFEQKKDIATSQSNIETLITNTNDDLSKAPTIVQTSASAFIKNNILHEEVFGPFAIVVICNDENEMLEVANSINGQLTTTIYATANELSNNQNLVDVIKQKCGRLILNSVPTGVEVCKSMQHGGPFPSSTDGRFGSVGEDAIKRFARPIAYQNWENNMLPLELKNENPLQIWRTINGELTKASIS